MRPRKYVLLVLLLTLADIATEYGAAWLRIWLGHVLPPSSLQADLVRVLARAARVGLWLLPLMFLPTLRSIGSLRLPRTRTVLLMLPPIACNLLFIDPSLQLPAYGLQFLAICYVFLTAAGEEITFRGYAVLNTSGLTAQFVVLTTATFFSLAHLTNMTFRSPGSAIANLPAYFSAGLALGIIRMVSGSIAWCVLLHFLVNLTFRYSSHGNAYHTGVPVCEFITAVASVWVLCLHPQLGHPKANSLIQLRHDENAPN